MVVETIFGFPGIGKLMIELDPQRDFAVIMAAIMVTAVAIFLMNIADRHRLRAARSAHPVLSDGHDPSSAPSPRRPRAALSPPRFGLLWADKFAFAAAVFLVLVGALRHLRAGAVRQGRRGR